MTDAVADFGPDEDAEDIRTATEARAEMAETSARPVPWDDVKAELGL